MNKRHLHPDFVRAKRVSVMVNCRINTINTPDVSIILRFDTLMILGQSLCHS